MLGQLIGTKIAPLLLQATPPNPGQLTPEQITQIALEALKTHPNPVTGILAMLVPFGVFATVFAILWLLLRQRRARMQARMELQKHLLDKFQSGKEFGEFLESKASQRFLEDLSSQSMGPKDRILTAMRNGIVLAALGLGMFGLSVTRKGFIVPAVIILALGIGFLISTVISYRLSRQWEQQKLDRENAPVS